MKAFVLSLAITLLSACAATTTTSSGTTSAPSRFVFRVDRTLDKSQGIPTSQDKLSYAASDPSDRWEVAIDGTHVELTSLQEGGKKLEGTEVKPSSTTSPPTERQFEIERGTFAGARFVVRGTDDAELTIFGSGVPVVSSERGKLITR